MNQRQQHIERPHYILFHKVFSSRKRKRELDERFLLILIIEGKGWSVGESSRWQGDSHGRVSAINSGSQETDGRK